MDCSTSVTLWYSGDLVVDPFRPKSIRLVIGLVLGLFWPEFLLVFLRNLATLAALSTATAHINTRACVLTVENSYWLFMTYS